MSKMLAFSSGTLISCLVGLLVLLGLVFYLIFYLINQKKAIVKEREESSRRLYELSILKELGVRAGYSLNVEEILQIITGSLIQFIDYTAVGYAVTTPEKIKVNIHIEKSVNYKFLNDIKKSMAASLSALTNKNIKLSDFDEVISGAIIVDEVKKKVGSLFNIPLVISGQVAGVLTIAHTETGLYKEEDMTILYKITGQASEAVSRLQEVVKIEQGKLNAMVESMGDGVLMVDPEYRIVVANPAVKRIINFNYSEKDKVLSIFDFVDNLGGKFDIHGRLEEAISKNEPYISKRIEIDNTFFEIGVYPVVHSPEKNKNKNLGAVVVFHDITHDIELEKVREEFTSMIVHELRSPLDSIKKIIELMVAGSIKADSDEYKEYLNMAHQSSSSMLEMVNDILDLSKLQAGKFEINKEDANIKNVIENRITFFKISANSKNLSLESSLSENIPEIIKFDPQAVKQILNNFISNAMKFTSQGGSILVSAFTLDSKSNFSININKDKFKVFPEISNFRIRKPSLCVVVSDTGIGISQDHLKDLFQTYKQVKMDQIDDESKGTGLGLVIAKGIAEAHSGNVGVVSREGIGSSFFFTIPLS
ncbi:MAG: PAS domain-containing protein [Candidatus Zambryskibacteria bacterium]|nr:PAS domain-containing protein [Candidatus Zambryskibacteria bacterium]